MSRILLYSLYEDLKFIISHFSCLYNQYIGLFLTLILSRLYTSPFLLAWNYSLPFSTAHPCPSWMTAVSDRKMLLFHWSPVDGDIFILLYCYCCWRPITQGLSYRNRSEEGWWNKWWVKVCCVCVCVHMQNCVFSGELISYDLGGLQDRCGKPPLSLHPQGPATLIVSLFTAALKLHGL